MSRIACWYSTGAASAVAAKLTLLRYGAEHEVVVVRCVVSEEHPDSDRFAADCGQWFGRPILNLRNEEYPSCEAVWEKRKYLAGVRGAPCTIEMKKVPRWAFEKSWLPDVQVFGFTSDESKRAKEFTANNPDVNANYPLMEWGVDKNTCYGILKGVGLTLPAMYQLGFNNNNCIGCVKAQSPAYWARVRAYFPEIFERRAVLSRRLNVRLVKGTSGKRERFFLDELPANLGLPEVTERLDCGVLCAPGGTI